MKLKAQIVPYSSIVGGGVLLLDERGAAVFQIGLRGTSRGITKEQTEIITTRLVELINRCGLEVEEGGE